MLHYGYLTKIKEYNRLGAKEAKEAKEEKVESWAEKLEEESW